MSNKQKIVFLAAAIVAVLIIAGFAAKKTSVNHKEETEKLPEKIEAAYNALQKDPNDINSYMIIALWKRDKGELDEAIKFYNAALEIRSADTLLLSNIADLYIRNKQYTQAEQAYLKIVENNPKWVSAYRSLADLYRYNLTEKQSEVPSILLKGLENCPEPEYEANFVGPLAVYYKDFGPKEEAIKWYERLILINPENETAKKELEELKSE